MKKVISLQFLVPALLLTLATGCGKSKPPEPGPAAQQGAPATPAVPGFSTATTEIDGTLVEATFSRLDGGTIGNIFDGNKETLIRTENAQTALIDLALQGTKKVSSVDVTTSTMDVGLKVTLTTTSKPEPLVFSGTLLKQITPTIHLDFGGTHEVKKIKLEITNLNGGDGHIHIYEVKFK